MDKFILNHMKTNKCNLRAKNSQRYEDYVANKELAKFELHKKQMAMQRK